MKKLIFLICFIAATFAVPNVNAQDIFQKGDGILNTTIGLGNALYRGGWGYTSSVPPLAASYEVCIVDDLIDGNGSIGVGGYVGFSSYRWRYNSNWGYNYSTIIIGPRGTFHYQFVENLDTYAGLLIGARIANVSEVGTAGFGSSYRASGSGVAYDTFIGARYFFNENIAAMAELGYGIAYLNIGASFRLK